MAGITGDVKIVRFNIHLLDEREVRDSRGHSESLYIIEIKISIGSSSHMAEVTLTNQESMGFRMLIGRTTMNGYYLVDPGQSFLMKNVKI